MILTVRRLESWKEIAKHLGRPVRTVQRWEREEGLPVHRHQHQQRGTVHAFADELDAWRDGRTRRPLEALEESASSGAPARPETRGGRRPRSWSLARLTWRHAATFAAFAIALTAGLAIATSRPVPPPAPTPSAGTSPSFSDLELGFYLLHRNQPERLPEALAAFERVIAAYPLDARALAGLALTLVRGGDRGNHRPGEHLERAAAAAERALKLAPDSPDALSARAWVAFQHDWRLDEAAKLFGRALEQDASSPFALHGLAYLLAIQARHDEAMTVLRRAQKAQPLSAALNSDGCWFFLYAHRFSEAEQEARRALALEPAHLSARLCVLASQRAQAQWDAAKQTATTIARELDDPVAAELPALEPQAALRRWRERLIERLDERRKTQHIPPGAYAYHYAVLGDAKRTFEYLERALAEKDPALLFVGVHPDFDGLRNDPRLVDLERRVGV